MKYKWILPLALLTGCTNPAPPTFVVREVPATSGPGLDLLRYPSNYRAYSVGRRIDPSTPTILHDSHVLYIREQPERWNLQPSEKPMDLPGAPRPAAEVPLPLDEQLRLELRKQKESTQAVEAQWQRLNQVTESIPPLLRSTANLTTIIEAGQKRIEERLRVLEADRLGSNKAPSLVITNQ